MGCTPSFGGEKTFRYLFVEWVHTLHKSLIDSIWLMDPSHQFLRKGYQNCLGQHLELFPNFCQPFGGLSVTIIEGVESRGFSRLSRRVFDDSTMKCVW